MFIKYETKKEISSWTKMSEEAIRKKELQSNALK